METAFEIKKSDYGYNAKRLREILGVKQEELAERMGVSQQTVSRFEQTPQLDDETLEKIATALNISVDAIKNFNEEKAVNFVANTFNDNSFGGYFHCSINPLEKIIELYNEKVELYERMLQAEKEKVSLLEDVLKGKK
ncbi:MAG: helix-turn-helix transcriptional regulator [Prevotella sp.]|jgi:transcriptional regulator with XRE-family HTH domain|nr:helix-turn-helix transcriptional regulator [Prevotella sp.]